MCFQLWVFFIYLVNLLIDYILNHKLIKLLLYFVALLNKVQQNEVNLTIIEKYVGIKKISIVFRSLFMYVINNLKISVNGVTFMLIWQICYFILKYLLSIDHSYV